MSLSGKVMYMRCEEGKTWSLKGKTQRWTEFVAEDEDGIEDRDVKMNVVK